LLGEGANARVFEAIDKYTGKPYAMKLYNKPRGARWKEPEILETLSHVGCEICPDEIKMVLANLGAVQKYIVRYVAYIRMAGQRPQLIMELIKGPNLQKILDGRNDCPELEISEKRDVLSQLLVGVSHIHH
jgi:serine/threonine protein kinase